MGRSAAAPALTTIARPRCVVLCRVSTEAQHLDVQRDALIAEAARRGFDLVEVVEDIGSGRKMGDRAGLRRVLELADARAIDVLLVAELSRIGRSLAGLSAAIERLCARGVGVVSLRESFDLGSSMGRMVVGILSVFAAFEADVLRERTRAGLTGAKARGSAVGNAPFGTTWVPAGDADRDGDARPMTLAPVAEQLATLRRARDLKRTGISWTAVAAALAAEGRTARSGRAWRHDLLAAAVRNPRVLPFLDAVAA